ncbi:UNVERIFIED_CONTAM: hypothetical protein NY603_36655, partial [Bacteroidetes bacterium 56_B9]
MWHVPEAIAKSNCPVIVRLKDLFVFSIHGTSEIMIAIVNSPGIIAINRVRFAVAEGEGDKCYKPDDI